MRILLLTIIIIVLTGCQKGTYSSDPALPESAYSIDIGTKRVKGRAFSRIIDPSGRQLDVLVENPLTFPALPHLFHWDGELLEIDDDTAFIDACFISENDLTETLKKIRTQAVTLQICHNFKIFKSEKIRRLFAKIKFKGISSINDASPETINAIQSIEAGGTALHLQFSVAIPTESIIHLGKFRTISGIDFYPEFNESFSELPLMDYIQIRETHCSNSFSIKLESIINSLKQRISVVLMPQKGSNYFDFKKLCKNKFVNTVSEIIQPEYKNYYSTDYHVCNTKSIAYTNEVYSVWDPNESTRIPSDTSALYVKEYRSIKSIFKKINSIKRLNTLIIEIDRLTQNILLELSSIKTLKNLVLRFNSFDGPILSFPKGSKLINLTISGNYSEKPLQFDAVNLGNLNFLSFEGSLDSALNLSLKNASYLRRLKGFSANHCYISIADDPKSLENWKNLRQWISNDLRGEEFLFGYLKSPVLTTLKVSGRDLESPGELIETANLPSSPKLSFVLLKDLSGEKALSILLKVNTKLSHLLLQNVKISGNLNTILRNQKNLHTLKLVSSSLNFIDFSFIKKLLKLRVLFLDDNPDLKFSEIPENSGLRALSFKQIFLKVNDYKKIVRITSLKRLEPGLLRRQSPERAFLESIQKKNPNIEINLHADIIIKIKEIMKNKCP